MTAVLVTEGDGPVILSIPHGAPFLPADVVDDLNDRGRAIADTDWHVAQLYDGLLPGATTVQASFHRYVIDANRPPDDASLYPGQNTTGLVPLTDFDGQPIWARAPEEDDIAARLAAFHAPYHEELAAQIARVRARHGVAILWDCHSIRSRIPFLFPGTLPDLSIGTADGTSCHPRLAAHVARLAAGSRYSHVVNGRFKGGWTTRHYGRPETGVHAIQMEIAQSAYLRAEAPPWDYDPARAAPLRNVLAGMLHDISALAPELQVNP